MTPVQHNVASRHINRHHRRQHGPETPPRVGPNSPSAGAKLPNKNRRPPVQQPHSIGQT